jgi:hypothetical protein
LFESKILVISDFVDMVNYKGRIKWNSYKFQRNNLSLQRHGNSLDTLMKHAASKKTRQTLSYLVP